MNFYFVKPSWTATAQATHFETNQKAPLRMLCVLVLLCFAKATLVCFAQLFLYRDCASHAFIEPKKHLCRCFWVFGSTLLRKDNARSQVRNDYFVSPSCTATAHATEAPTIGLLPMPMRPIISTCAGTDEEPANCASECILPIVSVMP